MYTELADAALHSGERIAVGVVEPCGDTVWRPLVEGLLGHKSPVNLLHVSAAFRGPLDDLQTLFYLGVVQGEPVTVAMLAGAHGAAIYGHVFTRPDWRQRGAAAALHSVLAADWRRRGYRVVTLGTDADGHARRLYEGIGFQQIRAGAGDMVWRDAPDTALSGYCPDMGVSPLRWDDWGWVSEALCAPLEPGEELPRSLLFRVRQPHYVDWPFITAMTGLGEPPSPKPDVRVLRQGRRAVGWAALLPDAARALGAAALELYLRPGARSEDAAHALFAALPWPEMPVLHACTTGEGYRAVALARHGFMRLAHWSGWWNAGRGVEALAFWVRAAGSPCGRPDGGR